MTDHDHTKEHDNDPRSVSDGKLRDEHSREEVERWREEANAAHAQWLDVMKNRYGKG